MKKVLLIALLAAFASATTMPILGKVLGFSPTAAYAGNQNGQGQDNDLQGDDNDGQ
jgi:hypothetical protein